MTERLPYEEQLAQQWNDLPLPDASMAWADMKRRLDEDDDRPLLPFWLRGCAGWLLLGLLITGLGWWILRPEKWLISKKQETVTTSNKEEKQKSTSIQPDDSTGTANYEPLLVHKDSPALVIQKDLPDSLRSNEITGESKTIPGKKNMIQPGNPGIGRKNDRSQKKTKRNTMEKPGAQKEEPVPPEKEATDSTAIITKEKKETDEPVITVNNDKKETASDSVRSIKKDSLAIKTKQDSIASPIAKKDTAKKRSFSFSAGIALHQQLPVDGQSFVPYSALGRKGSWTDYIPSLYIRLNRDEKWFIQSGFRYGAPQLVKELAYKSKVDTISSQKLNVTTDYLKKTFYHQLPLTFNYFIVPRWSLGGGIVWNRFAGAVSTKDIVTRDRFSGLDTVLSSGVIFNSRKADSNFSKSYFQATLETQYKWKRFSFGVNYSFGLQPYINIVLAGSQTREEKNSSLQLFIRYELWRQKKK